MANHYLRLTRASIFNFPQFTDVNNQPLAFNPGSPLVTVGDDVLQDEVIQLYLAQGTLVEVNEDGTIIPPPAAPAIQSDAERGVGVTRQERGAGANPEDGTAPAPIVIPGDGQVIATLPRNRQERGAGANPEDGTAVVPGKARKDVPQAEEDPTSGIDPNNASSGAAGAESAARNALRERAGQNVNADAAPGQGVNPDGGDAGQVASDDGTTDNNAVASNSDESTIASEDASQTTEPQAGESKSFLGRKHRR